MDTFLGDTQLCSNVPLCYSSTCQKHFMDLVRGVLCGDGDQPLRTGVISMLSLPF